MKRVFLFLVVFAFAGSVWAADPFIGTWKLNVAKSKASPAIMMPKSETAKYTAQGDGIKAIFDGVSIAGKPYHEEWSGKWDGTYYPFIRDGIVFKESATKIDPNTLTGVRKMEDGEEIGTYRMTVSKDGKTLTLEAKAKAEKGRPYTMELVYDKQRD